MDNHADSTAKTATAGEAETERIEVHDATQRVQEQAQTDRWRSIKANPKLVLLALFAS